MSVQPGVSHELAVERRARLSDPTYDLHLSLPGEPTTPVRGHLVITFSLADTRSPLLLDFAPDAAGRLLSCDVNGSAVALDLVHEHLALPAAALRAGPNTVRITFVAGDAPLNRRVDYLYTVFVPARARETFPCFDQPDLKARWALTLDLPDDWIAIANADLRADPAASMSRPHGRRRGAFEQTPPLPTYLFAFAAGRFLQHDAVRNNRRLRIYYTAGDAEAMAANHEVLYDAHAGALAWLEDYTAVPYPFGKFDLVVLPAFQFGGMEHPGAIFYNASGILLTPSATPQQHLARANLIAHETAHMWFGDLVTMPWFDDVWVKEVFANFMAARIVNPRFPHLDHDLRFLHAHYPAAYEVDRTRGANAIRQPLDNLADAGSLYGAIVYLKSPIVMRQLELMLGADSLRDGLRTYLARHAFGNASWPQLLDILAPRTDVDLHAWSREWIDQAGRPVVSSTVVLDAGRIASVAFDTHPSITVGSGKGTAAAPLGPQRLEVAVGRDGVVDHHPVWLAGRATLPGLEGRPAPDFILPNGRGLGYGAFRLDARSLAWLAAHLHDIPDALTRGSAWLTLWDAALDGALPSSSLLDLAMRALPLEKDPLNVQRILAYIERLFWIVVPPDARATRAADLEAVLRATLASTADSGSKAAVFASLRGVATTPATVDWLDRLWTGDARLDGLPLGEHERIALAKELAVRRGAHQRYVERQAANTASGERRDALLFIAPALSPDGSERDRFFATISRAEHRRREPWVVEGLRWLNHPLRSEQSVKYIRPALDLLEEVKRSGDIFLPKRWVDALLAGHRSAAAAAAVRAFLATRPPRFPPALVRAVEASAFYLLHVAQPDGSTDGRREEPRPTGRRITPPRTAR